MLSELLTAEGRAILEAVMRAVPSGLTLATSPDCTILRVSDFGSRLLQRPRQRLEGISVEAHTDAYQVLDPATRLPMPPDELPLTRAAVYGETVTSKEAIVVAEDGEHIPILCNAGPIHGPSGELLGGIIAWTDLRDQKALLAAQEAMVRQRDLLVRETHHRVKNHLQIIASIVEMEAIRRGPEVAEFAESIQRRLDVLAAAHEVSYKTPELGLIDAAQHIHRICDPLSSPNYPVVALVEASLSLTTDQATPLALITNEIICNALKHAFIGRNEGKIEVILRHDQGDLTLTITDNGVGLAGKKPGGTLGLLLVQGLVSQLNGECTLKSGPRGGAVFSLRFPIPSEANRRP